jgi:hypothetical protein
MQHWKAAASSDTEVPAREFRYFAGLSLEELWATPQLDPRLRQLCMMLSSPSKHICMGRITPSTHFTGQPCGRMSFAALHPPITQHQ